MREPIEAMVDSRSSSASMNMTPVACIDLDRFCEDCGYNLRTMAVHRDEHMGIPVVRCPECGKFQPANHTATALRPWLNRLTSFVLMLWILTVISVVGLFGLAEGGITYGTLDELTIHEGATVQRVGNRTIQTWSGSYGPLEVKEMYPEDKWFIVAILILSSATALACGAFLVVVSPHWHRAAYATLVLLLPIVANAIVLIGWHYEAPQLFDWGLRYVASHVGAQVLGGLAGVFLGRPLARLTIRIVLPPGVRPRLAYLWLADNKPFPRPSTRDTVGLLNESSPPLALPETGAVG